MHRLEASFVARAEQRLSEIPARPAQPFGSRGRRRVSENGRDAVASGDDLAEPLRRRLVTTRRLGTMGTPSTSFDSSHGRNRLPSSRRVRIAF
jgi:hypothetical protein